MEQKVFFKSKDGLKLCGVWHTSGKPTAKVIVLVHGMTVNKDEGGIFVELAELLKKNNYAVFRFDFRTHGESEGDSSNFTIAQELRDVESAIEFVGKKYQLIGLLGASFGGGVSVLYSAKNQDKIKALCLWNPCLNYEHIFLKPYLPWLKDSIGKIEEDFRVKG